MVPLISVWRLVELALVLAAAAGAGTLLLRLLSWKHRSSSIVGVRLLLTITLGLGLISYSVLAIGLLGGLYAGVIWGWLLLLALAGVLVGRDLFWREVGVALVSGRRAIGGLAWPCRLILLVIATLALLNLIGALSPPLNPDDLVYHFVGPQRYLQAHRIIFVPDKYYTNLPFTMEMLWTAAMAMDAGELAQLINWSIGLLVLGWIALLARHVGLDNRHVLLAAVLFYSITIVGHQSRTGNVELGGTLFILACLFVLLQWRAEGGFQWLVLAGILAGLYAGTKLPNMLAGGLLSVWVLAVGWRHSHRLPTAFTSALLFGIILSVVGGVWYLKAGVMTGNPIYPFLQSVLGGPPIRSELLNLPDITEVWLTRENPAWRLVLQPYRLVGDPQMLRGHVSPLFVALLPLAVASEIRASSRMGSLLLLSLLLYLYWVPTYFLIRAGLPVLALTSIPVAAAAFEFAKRAWFTRWAIVATVVVWLATGLVGVLRDIIPAVPVVAGQQSVDEYLLTRGPHQFNFTAYDTYLFINRELPEDARVLLWEPRGYYLRRSYIYALEFIQTLANPSHIYDPQFVVSELQRFGITHVAMNDNYLRRHLRQTLEATGKLDCLYEGRTMTVCALSPDS
ncbi:hypothetical protein MYX82_00145 [Acidobacteria bacterium AH-259-D05]|nr:hypothetical protein [Acidobacteria bacterium AH-259-D05]